jgi:hypothetical protein
MGTTKALTARDVFGAAGPTEAAVTRGVPDSPSLDHLLSKSVGAKNYRPVLRIGGHWGNNRGWLMFGDKGEVIAPIGKVDELFTYAFGGATGNLPQDPGSMMMPDPAATAKLQAIRDSRKSILDVIRGDVKGLQARLPAAQKPKMEQALTAIIELEKEIAGPGGSGGSGGVIAAPVQCKNTATIQQSVNEATEEKQKQARIIANSMACDVSRIAVWKLVASADGGTPFGGYHNTSHSTGNTDADNKLTQIETWFAEQISYLATQLKAMKDPLNPAGSVFDSTIIYWFNECTHGNHYPGNLPIVLLGSGGGKMETGRQLMIDKANNKYGNLLVSLAHAMGDTSLKKIGDSNACTGPLAGLLKPGISPPA